MAAAAPRVLLAAVVGAALTTAGTVVQVLVRNALADPFLLGVSSGASVGATRAAVRCVRVARPVGAVVGRILGALGAMVDGVRRLATGRDAGAATADAVRRRAGGPVRVGHELSDLPRQPAGDAVGAVLAARLVRQCELVAAARPGAGAGAAMVYLFSQARALNALAMGSDAAASLGVDVARLRRNLFLVTSLIAGLRSRSAA